MEVEMIEGENLQQIWDGGDEDGGAVVENGIVSKQWRGDNAERPTDLTVPSLPNYY